MRRGEIYIAELNPTVGRELRKRRPVVIVSNDANNRANEIITVVPLTSNVTKVQPFEVRLPREGTRLTRESKALPQQIRTISKARIVGGLIGVLTLELMAKLEDALRLHLGLHKAPL